MSSQTNILEVRNLEKFFRSYWLYRPLIAVKDISFEVPENQAFGFLGHNGAGKTTTIKCIMGLVYKTAGEIIFKGEPLVSSSQRSKIGYLPEHPYFYDHLSVEETLSFLGSLYDISKTDLKKLVPDTLERVGLARKAKSPVRALSKGLQQRLGIAQSIIHQPELLILDEPFSGLDPVGRKEIRELIIELKSEGTSIFMSSHILSDVEDICEKISILSHGEVKTSFSISEIPEIYGQEFEIEIVDLDLNAEINQAILTSAHKTSTRETSSGTIHNLRFKESAQANHALKSLLENSANILSFKNRMAALEDIFMKVTGEKYQPEERNKLDNSIES